MYVDIPISIVLGQAMERGNGEGITSQEMLEQFVRQTAVLRGSHPLLTSALKS